MVNRFYALIDYDLSFILLLNPITNSNDGGMMTLSFQEEHQLVFILYWWSRQAVYLLTQYQCLSVCLSKLQINCPSHKTALVQKKENIEKFKFTRAECVNTKRSTRFFPQTCKFNKFEKKLMSDSIQREPHPIQTSWFYPSEKILVLEPESVEAFQ